VAAYFECSSCRSVSLIRTTPPRCPVCGMKNGMILGREENQELLIPPPVPAVEGGKL
jgi:Zn finger protein HypA/HybF involved in hydrogenase expression